LDACRAVCAYPCRPVGRSARVADVTAILRPLTHVAVHVVQAECVRQECSARSRIGVAVAARRRLSETGDAAPRCQVGAVAVAAQVLLVVAEGKPRRRPRTRSIFPFGLRQQAVGLAGLGRQPFDVGLGITCTCPASRSMSAGPLISPLSLSTISAGVFSGAPIPFQPVTSYPGANSPMVGISGKNCERVAVVTARGRSLPAFMYPMDEGKASNNMLRRPVARRRIGDFARIGFGITS
jgi:hypothetical protein